MVNLFLVFSPTCPFRAREERVAMRTLLGQTFLQATWPWNSNTRLDSLWGADVFSAIFLAGETRAEKSVCSPQGRDEMKWQQVTLRQVKHWKGHGLLLKMWNDHISHSDRRDSTPPPNPSYTRTWKRWEYERTLERRLDNSFKTILHNTRT